MVQKFYLNASAAQVHCSPLDGAKYTSSVSAICKNATYGIETSL